MLRPGLKEHTPTGVIRGAECEYNKLLASKCRSIDLIDVHEFCLSMARGHSVEVILCAYFYIIAGAAEWISDFSIKKLSYLSHQISHIPNEHLTSPLAQNKLIATCGLDS